jgi:hypothetical protein
MSEREIVMGFEIDKCPENISIRIPEILKFRLDKLSDSQKKQMREELLIVMAKHVHNSMFDPAKYLSSEGL